MELTPVQLDLAERLSIHSKDACKLVGLRCERCEPRHFYLIVHRYYGRVQGMTAEVDRCIEWCLGKGKLIFTALRFSKWCGNKVRWDREQEMQEKEKAVLRHGNEFQRADYARRFGANDAHDC